MAIGDDELSFTLSEVLHAVDRTNKLAESMMAENRSNNKLLIAAFRDEAALTRQRLDQHDARITRLENNQPNA